FSSRRRHTRFSRDWSSDVCSSDLFLHAEVEFLDVFLLEQPGAGIGHHDAADLQHIAVMGGVQRHVGVLLDQQDGGLLLGVDADRSEERRVGSEGRSRGWAYESNRI